MVTKELVVIVGALCLALVPAMVQGQEFRETSDTVEGLQPKIDEFLATLGSANGNEPVSVIGGYRSVNWDGVADNEADPAVFPSRKFNGADAPVARGVAFFVDNEEDYLQVSSSSESGVKVVFGQSDEFPVFSEERVFAVRRDVPNEDLYGRVQVHFFMPDNRQEQGYTRGLGVVFSAVTKEGSSGLIFYNDQMEVIYSVDALVNDDGFSFVGYTRLRPEIFAVTIVLGNDEDRVVMDDVFYGEPWRKPGQTLYSWAAPTPSELAWVVDGFREELGLLNNNLPNCWNNVGRREVNWDTVPADNTYPNEFDGSFFNSREFPTARGIEFTSEAELLVSNDNGTDSESFLFGRPDILQAYSQERIFTANGGAPFEATFHLPCNNAVVSVVRGFGAVFTNARGADAAQLGINNDFDSVADVIIPVLPDDFNSAKSVSFVGAIYTRKVITQGRFVFPEVQLNTSDVYVAVDDIIYKEPFYFLFESAAHTLSIPIAFFLVVFAAALF